MRFEAISWMCWKMMLGLAPLGPLARIEADGARPRLLCWRWRCCMCWTSLGVGCARMGMMGTAMPKGVLGLSRALSGAFS